jgi:hypothetical protein
MIEDAYFAFPSHEASSSDPRNQISGGGMTLRDYFAAKALGALINTPHSWFDLNLRPKDGLSDTEQICRFAYQYADAMLKERSR